jgi:hypothetical protein
MYIVKTRDGQTEFDAILAKEFEDRHTAEAACRGQNQRRPEFKWFVKEV